MLAGKGFNWRWFVTSRSVKGRPSTKKKHPIIGLMYVLVVLLTAVIVTGVGIYALGVSWIGDLTEVDITVVEESNTARPSEMYASDGTTLLARFQLEFREPVQFDAISDYVKEGTVATEDERFYEHSGYDLMGIARAVVVTLTGMGREGASTITQQFVRNTILSDEMNDISLKRKLREMYLAVKVEEAYSKDAILLMYLNTINYGAGAYGIEAAAQRYFSKSASDLTLVEAATLVGIPQSPTNNNPLDYPASCQERRNTVLNRMLTNGCITQAQYDEAIAIPISDYLNPTELSVDGIVAYPYFTSYVRDTIINDYTNIDLFKGGLKIITTLDVTAQQEAERVINEKKVTLGDTISGALVAIDPSNGYVKALVGGDDYYTNQTNLATGSGTDGGRPCGSSFKTFTLLSAIENGISPQTMIDCGASATIPGTEYGSTEAPLQNIDNIDYGTRSIQRAFAVSSNTGFVRLQMALGSDRVVEMAKRLGITSDIQPYASLSLGQQNVTMLDMASAYSVVGNGGTKYGPQFIKEIYDYAGNLTYDNNHPEGERVLAPEVAHAAQEVMKTVVNTSEGTGTDAALPNGQVVAAKTGTSTNYKDITFCGTTPTIAVAVWFGDPQGGDVALPAHASCADVFRNFVSAYMGSETPRDFDPASDPEYDLTYSNSTYHIGGIYSATNETKPDEDKDSEDEDGDEDTDDTDSPTDDPNANPEPTPEPTPDPTPTPDPVPDDPSTNPVPEPPADYVPEPEPDSAPDASVDVPIDAV